MWKKQHLPKSSYHSGQVHQVAQTLCTPWQQWEPKTFFQYIILLLILNLRHTQIKIQKTDVHNCSALSSTTDTVSGSQQTMQSSKSSPIYKKLIPFYLDIDLYTLTSLNSTLSTPMVLIAGPQICIFSTG